MYPTSTFDTVSCLQSLVGQRTGCGPDQSFPFYLEDIDGVDVSTLASLAKSSNLSGVDFGNQLINSAAREMMADIEMLLNNGNRLREIVGDICSSCSILPVYVVNSGITIKSVVPSQFQKLQITKLSMLINKTGSYSFVIDDGADPKTFTANFTAGVIQPVALDYQTDKKSVTVYFSDNTVGLGTITCPNSSSCGCGGSKKEVSPVNISGLLNGVEVVTQYGFIPCAGILCSNDALVCKMIKELPNVFGITLLFKVGEKYTLAKANSNRNNTVASYGDQPQVTRNFGALYAARLNGTPQTRGVRNMINEYLQTKRTDKCVVCDAKISTAYVTG